MAFGFMAAGPDRPLVQPPGDADEITNEVIDGAVKQLRRALNALGSLHADAEASGGDWSRGQSFERRLSDVLHDLANATSVLVNLQAIRRPRPKR